MHLNRFNGKAVSGRFFNFKILNGKILNDKDRRRVCRTGSLSNNNASLFFVDSDLNVSSTPDAQLLFDRLQNPTLTSKMPTLREGARQMGADLIRDVYGCRRRERRTGIGCYRLILAHLGVRGRADLNGARARIGAE